MTKPHEFREVYIAIQNIPYHCESPQDLASDGVVAKGQLVWAQKMFDAEERSISISALLMMSASSLDPRWLVVAKCTDGEIADNPGVSVLMDRVASLEELVCDLLRQNEELRMALRESGHRDDLLAIRGWTIHVTGELLEDAQAIAPPLQRNNPHACFSTKT